MAPEHSEFFKFKGQAVQVSRRIAVSPLQPRLPAAHWRCAGALEVQQCACPSQGLARAAVMLA